jgi:ATP-dependent Clp protease, protease subunit
MRDITSEFKKFAIKDQGISSSNLYRYDNHFENMTRSVIEERNVNFREVDVFSRLMMDRIIFLGTGIDDHVANIIVAQLLFLQSVDPNKDITMYINSGGGGIYAGYGIIDTMDYITCDVSTICTGLAASMAAVTISNGTKGKRCALPHSRIMIHQPLGGARGQASEIEITYKEIQKLKVELYEILAANSGKSFEEIERDSDRDYWMTAQEAKEYGLIDEVVNGGKTENRGWKGGVDLR